MRRKLKRKSAKDGASSSSDSGSGPGGSASGSRIVSESRAVQSTQEKAVEAANKVSEGDASRRKEKVILVDGKIVISHDSVIASSMHRRRAIDSYEVTQEEGTDDVHSRVTSWTYSRRTSTERWTAEETKKFYLALSQCGTDFTMIGNLFPKRTRRQIKNKWKKENRVQPEMIKLALNRRLPFDVDAHSDGIERLALNDKVRLHACVGLCVRER